MNTRHTKVAGLALCLACLLMLPACGDILKTPEPLQTLAMHTINLDGPLCASQTPVQIIVNMPESRSGLNTDRIAMMQDEREIQYVRKYKWENTAPVMIQRMLVDTLNQSQCFIGAGSPNMGLTSPYRLMTEVMRMHYLYDSQTGKGEVNVHLLITLVDMEKGLLIGQHNATGSSQNNFSDAIIFSEELEKTLNAVVREAVEWSAGAMSDYLVKRIR